MEVGEGGYGEEVGGRGILRMGGVLWGGRDWMVGKWVGRWC